MLLKIFQTLIQENMTCLSDSPAVVDPVRFYYSYLAEFV